MPRASRLLFAAVSGVLLAVLGVAGAFAQDGTAEALRQKKLAVAEALFEIEHGEDTIVAWRAMLLREGAMPDCDCGEDQTIRHRINAAWRAAVEEAFDIERFRRVFNTVLVPSYTLQELERILAFRRSALGRRLSQLERPRTKDQDGDDLTRLARARRALDGKPSRKAIVLEITTLKGGAAALADALINVSVGSAIGALGMQTRAGLAVTPDEIVARIEAGRPQMVKALGPVVLAHNADIYQGLSLKELSQYRDTLASPLGRKSVRQSLAAFGQAMRGQAIEIGARFVASYRAEAL